jgi:nucleoside-diphosphate-sugar epimerase
MAKVLVFGSEGSLMQSVIPKLLAAGHEVIGFDNLFRYGERRDSAKKLDYRYYNTDLSAPYDDDMRAFIRDADVIIQAAARIFGVGGFNQFEADILSYDVNIQHNLLTNIVQEFQFQSRPKPHVIYISSSMVYETCPYVEGGSYEDQVEQFPAPKTAYGLSKYVGERMLKHYNKQYRIPYTIWRPFNIITPHEPADKTDIGVSHVFADFIENIVIQKKNPLPIIGDGEQIRCFTWIEDVASAIADNLENPKTINETFNLGNTYPWSMKTLAKAIKTTAHHYGIADDKPLEFVTVREFPDDVRIRIPNCGKAWQILGWQSTKGPAGSVEECIKYLLTNQA